MAPPKKHRLAPAKIPIELNETFEEAKATSGDTHTQAIERGVELYVKAVKRRGPPSEAEKRK